MFELAVLVRSIQLTVHHAHLHCARAVFMPDHLLLADIYGKAEDWFDGVCERMIGLGMESELGLDKFMSAVAEKSKGAPAVGVKENKEYFTHAMKMLNEVTDSVEKLCAKGGLSQGTMQFIGNIADEAEVFKYKVGQRLK